MTQTPNNDAPAEDLFQRLLKIKETQNLCPAAFLEKSQELTQKIQRINELKKEKNAVILVHTYVTPEIIYGIGDFVGDSYILSKKAMTTDADTIIFVAVRFMGETAKILNPQKTVLVPGLEDGCTLADAITAQQVRELRKQYPDHTFVCYINTTAEVKAECDVCVTSSNVNTVIQNIPNKKIYFLPDKMMGQNLISQMKKRGIDKEIAYFNGTCYVHEEFTLERLLELKKQFPNARVAAHPECRPEVCAQADFVGSTEQMYTYLKKSPDNEFIMLTECGLSARMLVEFPDKRIVGTCTFCKYMKSNTLDDVIRVLTNPAPRDFVEIDESVRKRAKKCVENMFKYAETPPTAH
ncbi:MAG: quinolinate synthase NadA [Candidatus Omnitrophota bacterium]